MKQRIVVPHTSMIEPYWKLKDPVPETDPLGSYTGVPKEFDYPVQDADDL